MGSLQLFIRHPEQIAIDLSPAEQSGSGTAPQSIGLICCSDTHWEQGSELCIQFPDSALPAPQITGTVLKCTPSHDQFELAIQFDTPENLMKLRMMEQQAYIQLYKKYIEQHEGRSLSDNEAAARWIELYADTFPGLQG